MDTKDIGYAEGLEHSRPSRTLSVTLQTKPAAWKPKQLLEIQLQSKLQHAVRFSDRNHSRRAWQRRCAAASSSEQRIIHAGCSRTGIPWVVEVRVIQHIKCFCAELKIESFSELEVLQEPRIQVPELRTLSGISAAALLSRRWNAEERLSPDHIPAIEIRIAGVRDKRTNVVHHWTFDSRHELQMTRIKGPFHQGSAHVLRVRSLRATIDGIWFAALVIENARVGPASNHIIEPLRNIAGEPLSITKRKLVNRIHGQHMAIVEVGAGTI